LTPALPCVLHAAVGSRQFIVPDRLLYFFLLHTKNALPEAYTVKYVALTVPVLISQRAIELYIKTACDVFDLKPEHVHLV
jgi:hypothetical protein